LSTVITIANQKGGIGKTTVSMSLIGALHHRNFRVLGVDMDPQGSLGFSAGLDIENNYTIYDVMKGAVPIQDAIVHSDDTGDFLISNILLSSISEELRGSDRMFLLRNELAKISGQYDFVIIDTPPGLSVLTTNAYCAANGLIIPTRANILEVLAVSQIRDTIREIHQSLNPNLKVLGILINFYDRRLTLGKEVTDLMETLAREMNTKVFKTRIRSTVSIAEAPAHAESIITYARAGSARRDFLALTDEILQAL